MDANVTTFTDADRWNRALYAFLAEKERRSGSRRTVEGYSRMLRHFFGIAGKPPDRITSQDVFAWAYGTGLSGNPPSSVTIGARLACLSSFYRFLIRMDAVASNPCDALERPKVSVAPPRGLIADDIRRLLAVIPETPVGLRDRAIVLTLTLTGRRRAEVLNMTAGDLFLEDGKVWYRYRGKGGKTGKRELPQPVYAAIMAALAAFGHDIAALPPEAPLWPASGRNGAALTSGTFYANPPALLPGRGVARVWRPHLPALSGQAPARRRREHCSTERTRICTVVRPHCQSLSPFHLAETGSRQVSRSRTTRGASQRCASTRTCRAGLAQAGNLALEALT